MYISIYRIITCAGIMSVHLYCNTCGRYTCDVVTPKCADCHILPEYKYLDKAPWIKEIDTNNELFLPRCNKCKKVADRSWFEEKAGRFSIQSEQCCICRHDYHIISQPSHIAIRDALHQHNLNIARIRRKERAVECTCGSKVAPSNKQRHDATDKHIQAIQDMMQLSQQFRALIPGP